MKKTVLFNELNLIYPDDFNVMSEDELKKYFKGRVERWGIRDPERHMLFSVSRSGNLYNGLMSRITDSKSVAKGAGNQMKKTLHEYKKRYDINQMKDMI